MIGFAGDAITCWFDDADGPAALRAVACALAMQAVMASFAAIALPGGATTALSDQSCGHQRPGPPFRRRRPAVQRLDVLAGAPIARLAAGEHLATKGEVLIDEMTASDAWQYSHSCGLAR